MPAPSASPPKARPSRRALLAAAARAAGRRAAARARPFLWRRRRAGLGAERARRARRDRRLGRRDALARRARHLYRLNASALGGALVPPLVAALRQHSAGRPRPSPRSSRRRTCPSGYAEHTGAMLILAARPLPRQRPAGQRAAAPRGRACRARYRTARRCRSRSSTATPTPSCRPDIHSIPLSQIAPERTPDACCTASATCRTTSRTTRSRPPSTAPPPAPDCADAGAAAHIAAERDVKDISLMAKATNLPFDGAITRYFEKRRPRRSATPIKRGRQGRRRQPALSLSRADEAQEVRERRWTRCRSNS